MFVENKNIGKTEEEQRKNWLNLAQRWEGKWGLLGEHGPIEDPTLQLRKANNDNSLARISSGLGGCLFELAGSVNAF